MAGKMAYLSQEEKQKIRNALKIKKSLDKEEENHHLRASSPESEEVDFKKVIHPLSYYIHDREQMMEEVFSIIKDDKLRKMLSPLLKNYTLEEIKADCLVHLLGMSKKRILAIIEGRELYSSSDSESESSSTTGEPDEALKSPNNKVESRSNFDEDDLLDISISEKDIDSLMKDKPTTANKSKKPRTRIRKKIKIEKDVSLFSIVISDDDLDDKNSKKPKKINRERASDKLDKILGSKEKGRKRKKSGNHSKSNATGNTDKGGDNDQKLDNDAASLDTNDKGKTLLEILELEMRARAIRALLKNTNDVEEGSSGLSAAVKSTDATTKSDSKIVSAIAEAIDQSLSDKNTAVPNDDSDPDDVEIIDDIDLCVLIDDDDDISMETNSAVPAAQTNTNEKCDPPENDSDKLKLIADSSEKSKPSNDDDAKNSNDDTSNRSKSQADSEQSKPSTNDSEKSKSLDDLETNEAPKNDSEKSEPAKGNTEKRKLSADNLEKQKPSKNSPETSKSLPDDAKKRKLSKDNSGKNESSTNIPEKRRPLKNNSKKNKPLTDESGRSNLLKDESPEKFMSSVNPSAEKLESSVEKSTEKCETPKERDFETDCEKLDLTKDDTPENVEDLTNSTDNLTWSDRWAEKQNVKEVVKNSKICANIRKRMRFARMLKQKQSEESKPIVDEIDIGTVEESSVAHYNLIKAHTSKNVDNTSDNSKAPEEQSDPPVKTSQEAPENDTNADIITADHTLTILESDPKTLIIDISDDEVVDECDNS